MFAISSCVYIYIILYVPVRGGGESQGVKNGFLSCGYGVFMDGFTKFI